MSSFGPVTWDKRGFLFAAKCLVALVIVCAGVSFGTAFGADKILAEATDDPAIRLKLAEIRDKRLTRSSGEMRLLEKLQEYESELATRSIGTASIDAVRLAHSRLIAADLSDMKLYLYENGYAIATYVIQSKGKRGSRWETPTGLYKIETKEEDHFSTIGFVHMPKSMQFFGNFFIHGWPYYPDGTPVPEGYSGGCIRLSTEDAGKVFEFAERDTPIFVWEDANASTTRFSINEKKLPPKVSARSFLIADIRTGDVYAEKNPTEVLPIASLTKLVTALVANETIHYDRTLTVNSDDRRQTEGTPGSILANDSFEVGELLYALLMESNNSVAYALSRYSGSDNFIRWMNDKAQAIGMQETRFDDPSGISPNNVASANDLFKLARYIHNSQSFILNITREKEKKIHAENERAYTLSNFNHFAGTKEFLGGKTGYTSEAGETMVAMFELPIQQATATIAIIVLDSEDRKKDIEKLLSWFKSSAATTSITQASAARVTGVR